MEFEHGDQVQFLGPVYSAEERFLVGLIGTVQYTGTRINVTFPGINDDDLWFRPIELKMIKKFRGY